MIHMNATPGRTGPSTKPTDPSATLERIDARLERLEALLGPLAEMPHAMGTVGDILDEQARRLGDVDERMAAAAALLERVSRPETLRTLGQLVDLLEKAPQGLATATDILDEVMESAGREGVALDQMVGELRTFAMLLLRAAPDLNRALGAAMISPATLRVLGDVTASVAEATGEEPPRVGLMGMMRGLRDEDMGRAMGFLLRVGKNFGRTLKRESKRLASG